MFDSLIDNIKEKVEELRSKLPGGNKDEDFDEETETDLTATNVGGTKTGTRKKFFSKGNDDNDEDFDDDEEDEEDESSAKRSKLIRVFVVAGLAYFGVTEFVLKEEPAPAPVQKVAKKKPVKKVEKKEVVKDKTPDLPKESSKNESVSVKNNDDKVVDSEKDIEKKSPEITQALEPESEVEQVQDSKAPKAEDNETIADIQNEVSQIDETDFNSMMDNIESEVNQNTQDNQESNAGTAETMEDQLNKIVEKVKEEKAPEVKVEYIKAPDYENFGRGLVYNCVDGHWACVDRNSWLQCRQNDKWTKQNNKEKECVISDVFASMEDCRVMQLEKINQVSIPDCK